MTVRGFAPPVAFYIATSAPTQGPKGALWSDTSMSPPDLMICTSVTPVTWADHNGSGGGGSPGGSDTYVQFNDGGSSFGGDAGLTYNKTSNTLTTDILNAGVSVVSGLTGGSAAVTKLTAQGSDGQTADIVKVRAGAMPAYLDVFGDPSIGGGPGNSNLLYTARANGTAGNSITIEYVQDVALSVSVIGSAITIAYVNSVTTANQIMTAVQGDAAANALVSVSLGDGSDGTGIPGPTLTPTNLAHGLAARDVFAVQPRGEIDLESQLTVRVAPGQLAHGFRYYDDNGDLSIDMDYQGKLDARQIVVQNPPDTGGGNVSIGLNGTDGTVLALPASGKSAFEAKLVTNLYFRVRRPGLGTDNAYLELVARNNDDTLFLLSMPETPTSDLFQVWNYAFDEKMFRLNSNAGIVFRQHSAPDSSDLTAGDCALWFDQTNTLGKLMIKAKTADGTVATGFVALT